MRTDRQNDRRGGAHRLLPSADVSTATPVRARSLQERATPGKQPGDVNCGDQAVPARLRYDNRTALMTMQGGTDASSVAQAEGSRGRGWVMAVTARPACLSAPV